jgi:hypothetical protein
VGPGKCSRKVQQPYRMQPTADDRSTAVDLHKRLLATSLPLNGKEVVIYAQQPVDEGQRLEPLKWLYSLWSYQVAGAQSAR